MIDTFYGGLEEGEGRGATGYKIVCEGQTCRMELALPQTSLLILLKRLFWYR